METGESVRETGQRLGKAVYCLAVGGPILPFWPALLIFLSLLFFLGTLDDKMRK
jgi:hypothetical protein